MTKREAAIVSAYTGILVGDFSDMHGYIEQIMGRPVFTHELGNKTTFDKIKALAKDDFCSITISDKGQQEEV
jgi:hypothetical protein